TRSTRDWSSDVCSSDLRVSVPFEELALLGAIPAESAAAALDGWLHALNERQVVADPPWVNHCYRSFLAAEWWAERRDTVPLLKRSEERRVGKGGGAERS